MREDLAAAAVVRQLPGPVGALQSVVCVLVDERVGEVPLAPDELAAVLLERRTVRTERAQVLPLGDEFCNLPLELLDR